jgi:hypothetical protein
MVEGRVVGAKECECVEDRWMRKEENKEKKEKRKSGKEREWALGNWQERGAPGWAGRESADWD